MAHPVMFSAMTTGPDTPKTWPKRDSRSSSLTLGRSLFAFWRAPAIVDDGGEEIWAGAQNLAMNERRQGRLTTVSPVRKPLGSCRQSLAAPHMETDAHQRHHGRLRVD